jgi:hypothetical protein
MDTRAKIASTAVQARLIAAEAQSAVVSGYFDPLIASARRAASGN